MVGKNSEYHRAYPPRSPDYLRESYDDNLDYRNLRRQTECWHSVDPFTWNEKDNLRDVPSDLDMEVVERRPASVPLHKYKHDLYNKEYAGRSQQKQIGHFDRPAVGSRPMTALAASHKAIQTPHVKDSQPMADDDDALKLDLREVVETSDDKRPHHESTVTSSSPPVPAQQPQKPVASPAATKPKNPRNTPVKTAGAPKMRPQSAPAKAVAKSEPPKAPFVPYGCKDRGYELGHKKTHNVRASADIYPAALRAQKLRQAEKTQKKKEKVKINILEFQKQQFLEKMKRETEGWNTEYRQNFPAYNNDVYQENLSNRLNPRRVWQVLYMA